VFFIEFKRPKAEPRKQQVLVIDEMVQFGAKVYVTDDYETACGIINDIINFGEA
jgi:L-lactate utilization protein LutB